MLGWFVGKTVRTRCGAMTNMAGVVSSIVSIHTADRRGTSRSNKSPPTHSLLKNENINVSQDIYKCFRLYFCKFWRFSDVQCSNIAAQVCSTSINRKYHFFDTDHLQCTRIEVCLQLASEWSSREYATILHTSFSCAETWLVVCPFPWSELGPIVCRLQTPQHTWHPFLLAADPLRCITKCLPTENKFH